DLYAGRGRASWERVERQWPALRRSLLLQLEDVRLRVLHIRAYSAIAAGLKGSMLRTAARDAAAIARIDSRGAKGIAGVVPAAVASKRGDARGVDQHLEAAVGAFDAAEMALYAAAACRRLGEHRGGPEGVQMIESADRTIASQTVVAPERLADVLAPAFRSV